MFIAKLNVYQAFEDTVFNRESLKKLEEYFNEEQQTFDFFYVIKKFCRNHLLGTNDHYGYISCKDPLRIFVYSMIYLLSHKDSDDSLRDVENDYGNIEDIAFNYIEKLSSPEEKEHLKRIKNMANVLKSKHIVDDEYSLNKIILALKQSKNMKFTIQEIAKIPLLTNDYFNIDAIYNMRQRVFRSSYMKKYTNTMIMENPSKDTFSLIFSDYNFLTVIIDIYMEVDSIFQKIDKMDSKSLKELFLVLVYGKIILNMYIFLFQNKEIVYMKNLDVDDDWRIENNKIKMTIMFARLYNGLALILYHLCAMRMSDQEIISLLMIKLCDEICIREETSIQYDRLNRCYSLKSSLNPSLDATRRKAPLIKKYKGIIVGMWDNGSKKSHGQIISELAQDPRYADEIKIIRRDLSSEIYHFCLNEKDENGNRKYPYAQGYDYHGRQKSE